MFTERVLKHIPGSRIEEVMASFRREGCTEVTKESEGGDLWTVRAQCPDGDAD